MDKSTYRTDPMFLRNGYETEGRWNFPIVKKQEISINDGVELIAVSDTSRNDTKEPAQRNSFFCGRPAF